LLTVLAILKKLSKFRNLGLVVLDFDLEFLMRNSDFLLDLQLNGLDLGLC
jgi:hypothetical protein